MPYNVAKGTETFTQSLRSRCVGRLCHMQGFRAGRALAGPGVEIGNSAEKREKW